MKDNSKYAILGEDRSDVEMIDALVRRISITPNASVFKKGYQGGPELLAKGALQIRAYNDLGANRFIICYDADNGSPANRYSEIIHRVVKPSNVSGIFCALVPIQEIEAWILADLAAVSRVHTSWKAKQNFSSPENINNPKEVLIEMTQRHNLKPLYNNKVHNPQVAKHLSLQQLATKCPSSLPLFELVHNGIGNCPTLSGETIAIRSRRIIERLKNDGVN